MEEPLKKRLLTKNHIVALSSSSTIFHEIFIIAATVFSGADCCTVGVAAGAPGLNMSKVANRASSQSAHLTAFFIKSAR